uniref:Uncharacterized protein n=1 Tax=Arundo donax TaxID=35708 RepID=A0A0A9GN89_ARUDO
MTYSLSKNKGYWLKLMSFNT